MKKLTLSRGLIPLALIATFCAPQAFAGDSDVSVSVSTDYVTEYVFRGVTLAGEAFQPGAEISVGNFTAGVWASVAVGEESVFFGDEIDIYAGYSFDVSETISADVGVTLYHYPQLGGLFDIGANDAGTVEVYTGLSLDAPLAPSVTAYYDFNFEAFTLEGSAEHSFPVGEKTSFDVGATAGLVTVSGGGDYQYGSLSGSLGYGFNDSTSVYVGVNGGLSSQTTFADTNFDITNLATISAPKKSSVWFGAGISSGF